VPFVALLALFGAACTGDDGPTPSTQTSASESVRSVPSKDIGDTVFVPGEFSYEYLGVKATLSWAGSSAELRVDNGGDTELGRPGLYAVTNDQREVPAELPGAAPVPPGGSATFDVTFPRGVTLEQTGLVVLLFGDQNWGALAPVAQT
jgi:hypothetical protein